MLSSWLASSSGVQRHSSSNEQDVHHEFQVPADASDVVAQLKELLVTSAFSVPKR